MTPARHPHPQRCIHSRVCRFRFVSDADCDGLISGDASKESRCTSFSAPHTSAPAPAATWIRNIHSQELLKEILDWCENTSAEAAKAAHEQVLKELYLLAEDMISDGQRMIQDEPMGKLYGKGKVTTASVFQMRIESLRSQQEAEQP